MKDEAEIVKNFLLDRLFGAYSVRSRLRAAIREAAMAPAFDGAASVPLAPMPAAAGPQPSADGRKALFITARFRTGSTLLWSLFDQVDGLSAFYEPLNERRWFDPSSDTSGRDTSHVHERDIGAAYRALPDQARDVLAKHFTENWTYHRLYMDRAAGDEALDGFVGTLIDHAPGYPVLQFNRADFRLGWLKSRFPEAKLLHLYRQPRAQWMSSLHDRMPPRDITLAAFAPYDRFYLRAWARDLTPAFPFLGLPQDWHPYALFYLIWRLSYSHGLHFADHSLSYEDLLADPDAIMADLFTRFDLPGDAPAGLRKAIRPPAGEKWRDYADEDFFAEIEARCERILLAAFSPQ